MTQFGIYILVTQYFVDVMKSKYVKSMAADFGYSLPISIPTICTNRGNKYSIYVT
jgi:hypothetical protein